MDVVLAIHAAAAVLLLIAGLAKLSRPAPTADLVGTLGLDVPVSAARVLGGGEVALGTLVLVGGGPGPAVAMAVLYLAFALVVVRALWVGAGSCGCFGRADTPPSWLHVAGNVVWAGTSVVAATTERTPVDVMSDQPAAGVPFVVLVGVIAGLAVAMFTALPEALAAHQPGSSGPTPFRMVGSSDDRVGGSR